MHIETNLFGTTIIDNEPQYYSCTMPNIAAVDEQCAKAITELAASDTELGHNAADKILCELLASLGYAKTVKAFQDLDKWYA